MGETGPLRDSVASYIGGGWGADRPSDEFSEPAWVIRGTDFPKLRGGDNSSCPYRFHKRSNLASRRLRAGDIIVEVSGGSKDQPVGRALLVTTRMLSAFDGPVIPASFCKLLRPDTSRIDPAFLCFFLQHLYDTREIVQFQVQSTGISNLQFEALLDGQFIELPALDTQGKVSAILCAYDDLIENNNRRVRVLEEMAQRTYCEWFVDFRYPGHESVPLRESELGPIPAGWQVMAFTDIADALSGGTPRTTVPEFWDGDIPFFTPRDAPDSVVVTSTQKHVTEAGLDRCNSELYPTGTVFITARGTVGKVAMAGVPMAMNQSCYAIRGRNGMTQEFVLFALMNQVDYLQTNTGGATFDTIIVDTFRRMRAVQPPTEVVDEFHELVEPMLLLITRLQHESKSARATRDLLLSPLISGKIDVENLDIIVSDSAA